MPHSALEEHLRDAVCPRCKQSVAQPWKSEFWSSIHYLTTHCKVCEYKLFYRASFLSDGID